MDDVTIAGLPCTVATASGDQITVEIVDGTVTVNGGMLPSRDAIDLSAALARAANVVLARAAAGQR